MELKVVIVQLFNIQQELFHFYINVSFKLYQSVIGLRTVTILVDIINSSINTFLY